ncbi:hypothetical protein [Streptomyces sp. b84]|uniref:hypothetical protein n=1 Tax=Streptomyces sp. b84 TaxID=1827631 RepID=UPI0015CF1157|nr:hypothetical protein [Streptomyces sp. b84]
MGEPAVRLQRRRRDELVRRPAVAVSGVVGEYAFSSGIRAAVVRKRRVVAL